MTRRRETGQAVLGGHRRRKRQTFVVMALAGALAALGLVSLGQPANEAKAVSGPDMIRTIAGTGAIGNTGDGGPATSAQVDVIGVGADVAGNVYATDTRAGVVRKIDPSGVITRFAGLAGATAVGDGGPATSAQLSGPHAIVFDVAGNAYIAEWQANRVRKITPGGIITTVAGTGAVGRTGDNGLAKLATLALPRDVAIGAGGDLYIADANNSVVRKVNAAGVITTVAGDGNAGSDGDGLLATSAKLSSPRGVLYAGGNLYIADAGAGTIRKVDANGVISTIAGASDGKPPDPPGSPVVDGVPATSIRLQEPNRMAMDSTGSLYVSDYKANRIRKILPNGVITTVAGNGGLSPTGDGGPANLAAVVEPMGVALKPNGSLLIGEFGTGRVREVVNAASAAGGSQYVAIAVRKQSGLPVGCNDVNWAAQQGLIAPVEVRWLSGAGVKCPDATVSAEGVPSEQYVVMLALASIGQLTCADIQWNAAYGFLTWSAMINLATPASGCSVSPYAKMVTLRASNRLSCADIDWNVRNGVITTLEYGWLAAPPLGCPPLA